MGGKEGSDEKWRLQLTEKSGVVDVDGLFLNKYIIQKISEIMTFFCFSKFCFFGVLLGYFSFFILMF